MALGPFMIDIAGLALTTEDREILRHPLIGGVILFSRNYANSSQLTALTAEIHALRTPPLLIAVDHEGGRVQRFRDGFTALPACGALGAHFRHHGPAAITLAEQAGYVMAAELRAVGVDFSFAPVVDLRRGVSAVIGDRAFDHHPDTTAKLALAMVRGMRAAGMAAVAKHFPGHGAVAADSHHEAAVDNRALATIVAEDGVPFARLIRLGLPAVMAAHVVYPQVDPLPAGFSRYWLHTLLRREMGFQGAIFSDDLSMAAAQAAGIDMATRASAALHAGCDMVLICNHRAGVIQALERLSPHPMPLAQVRFLLLHGRPVATEANYLSQCRANLATLNQMPELGLGDDNILI